MGFESLGGFKSLSPTMSFIPYLKMYIFGLELRIGKELDLTALGKLTSSLTYNLPGG